MGEDVDVDGGWAGVAGGGLAGLFDPVAVVSGLLHDAWAGAVPPRWVDLAWGALGEDVGQDAVPFPSAAARISTDIYLSSSLTHRCCGASAKRQWVGVTKMTVPWGPGCGLAGVCSLVVVMFFPRSSLVSDHLSHGGAFEGLHSRDLFLDGG